MKRLSRPLAGMFLGLAACTGADAPPLAEDAVPAARSGLSCDFTPVEAMGQLSVEGGKILDEQGRIAVLEGPSFFWTNSGFYQFRFYTAGAVTFFAEAWNASVVRVAVGAQFEGSILEDPEGNFDRVITLIDAAIENGIYVIVDWHTHEADLSEVAAADFFREIAFRYGDTPNIIYEIFNEPRPEIDWAGVIKPYSERMIDVIREIDPDNLIIVGTQSYSQRVDLAAADPIEDERNIVYALHFYAATHLHDVRAQARTALAAGLPIFVSEWAGVQADGDGLIDPFSTEEWLAIMRENDLSHTIWSVSDTANSNSMILPTAPDGGPFNESDLSQSGKFARDLIRNWKTDHEGLTLAEMDARQ